VPPKGRFPPEAVLDAALEVVRRDGLRAVSARSVAKVLGASTAPVSAAYASMAALVDAVVATLVDRLVASLETAEGPDPLRAAAFAFARFTADQPRFYEALFLLPHAAPPDWVRLRRAFAERLDRSPRFVDLDARQRDALAWRASVVTHGICIEIWSGRWTRTDDDALRRLVEQLVEPVIVATVPER
jgi:AcrR family transcriptional regulator